MTSIGVVVGPRERRRLPGEGESAFRAAATVQVARRSFSRSFEASARRRRASGNRFRAGAGKA
eukprot:400678-Alexandrium_andersonii.AAC.1